MLTLNISRSGDGVGYISLNRPAALNAFDETMIAELTEAFSTFGSEPEIRAIVLTAEGRLFSSGADIGWMERQATQSSDDNRADAQRFAEMLRTLHECPKPTVVRVHGNAFGGAVGLMAAADIVIAMRGSQFAISEVRFGILPAVIGPYLVRALGVRQAQRMAMSARLFDAAEACRLGLVHDVVEAGDLDACVAGYLNELRAGGPTAAAEIKTLYRRLQGQAIDADTRGLTAETIARVRATDEAREGFAAFLAKRPPRWAQT